MPHGDRRKQAVNGPCNASIRLRMEPQLSRSRVRDIKNPPPIRASPTMFPSTSRGSFDPLCSADEFELHLLTPLD